MDYKSTAKYKAEPLFLINNMRLIHTNLYFARSLKRFENNFSLNFIIYKSFQKFSNSAQQFDAQQDSVLVLQFASPERWAFVATQIVMLIGRKSLNFN